MRRKTLFSALSLAAAGLLLSGGVSAGNRDHDRKINVDLTGFEEVPVVITSGNGGLKLTINESARTIDYVLTFADLQADITQAHIHVAQKSVNGGIVLWLCQTTGTPAPAAVAALTPFCNATAGNTPRAGTVTGTLRDANALGTATQQLAAGNLDDVLIAIAAGKAYGNVHTTVSPGGEIRGQLKHDHGRTN
jgi:CHRD domain